ncbi:hypothetical protein CMK14_08795 [Candidatus Poribacteria bacterium]|nr:hypothetical protein [Candidatus Poribacteria bacterium]
MKIYRPLSDQWAVFLDGKIKSAGWVAGDASLDRSLTDSIGLAMTKHASTKRDVPYTFVSVILVATQS